MSNRPTGRPLMVSDKNFARRAQDLVGGRRFPDAPRLAPAAGQHLRLDHHRQAQIERGIQCLFSR